MGSCKEELCVAGELAYQAQLQVAITLLHYTDLACTSVPYGWSHSTRKDVQPGKVIEVIIRKDKEAWAPFDPRKEGEQDISESNETHFLNGLQQIRPTAQILKSMESCLHSQRRNKLYMTKCTECRLV